MKIMQIYTLSDPITGMVRYIGQTNNLKVRFYKHIDCKDNTHRSNWIKSLKSKNLLPIMEVLEECTNEDVNILEIYWINQFKVWGFDLTNHSIGGGQGNRDRTLSSETKNKISQALIEYYKTNNSPTKGIKQSKETIEKRRVNLIGKNKGQKRSEKFRIELSKIVKEHFKNGRKGWNKGKRIISDDEILKIKQRIIMGEKQNKIAEEYKVAKSVINQIHLNKYK